MIRDANYWRRRLADALNVSVRAIPAPTICTNDEVEWSRGRWGVWLPAEKNVVVLYQAVVRHTLKSRWNGRNGCRLSRLPRELRRPVLWYVFARLAQWRDLAAGMGGSSPRSRGTWAR